MNKPAPHFLLPLVAAFWDGCLLSILQHPRPWAHNLPFAFPRSELKLKFVVSLWSTDSASFLSVFTSPLPKFALTATEGVNREPAIGWGQCGYGGGAQSSGMSLCHLRGGSTGEASPGLIGELLDGILDILSRICIPLNAFWESYLKFSSLFLTPSHAAHDSVLWLGWERDGPLGQLPAQLG